MFAAVVRSLRCAFLTNPFRVTKPIRRPRLGFEPLEAREVPALFTWLGGSGSNPTDAGVAANWTQSLSSPYTPSATTPSESDDIAFRGSVSNVSCTSFGSRGGYPPYVSGYNSVSIVSSYTGTVSMISQTLDLKTLYMDAPDATLAPYSDFTVSVYLELSRGTIGPGYNPNGTALHLKGGTTSSPSKINPGSGNTFTSGVRISAEDSAVLTTTAGTLHFSTARTLVATGSSDVTLKTLTITTGVTVPQPITVKKTQTADNPRLTVEDMTAAAGLKVEGGTAIVAGANKTASFTKRVNPSGANVNVEMTGGALVVSNGSTLSVGSSADVEVYGGKLATRAVSTLAQDPANIVARCLYVMQSGSTPTEVTISDTAYNATGTADHYHGTLQVTGDVIWTGGTYRPVVNTAYPSAGDLWKSTKKFYVLGGANGAVVAPGPGSVAAGTTEYLVIQGEGGIWDFSSTAALPVFEAPAAWEWKPNTAYSQPGAIVKDWKVRRK